MDREDLLERVAAIRWWHSMDLGRGVVTRGEQGRGHGTQQTLQRVQLPGDLTGKTVLDVGAWDGFFSFEAERRGASRVLATDSHAWTGAGWGSQAGFLLAREALDSHVEDLMVDVMHLDADVVGRFDVVLFLGVLYHLEDPLGALRVLRTVTRERLILETHVDLRASSRLPVLTFYPNRELDGDATNWWGPNVAAVEELLRAAGFSTVEGFDELGRPLKSSLWTTRLMRRMRGRTRLAFHARP